PLVIYNRSVHFTVEIMPGRKFAYRVAYTHQGLHFRCHIEVAVLVVPGIQGANSDMVAADHEDIILAVIERKGKDSIQVFEKINALLPVKSQYDLAVRFGQEIIRFLQGLLE